MVLKVLRGFSVQYQLDLFVTFQLLHERPLLKKHLQPFLRVVMTEFLKRGPALVLHLTWVLESRGVHDQQRTERMLTRLQSSENESRENRESVLSLFKKVLAAL